MCSRLFRLAEQFLEGAGFDRGPWLAVGFAAGVAAWFVLANRAQWLALLAGCLGLAGLALAGMAGDGRFPRVRQALAAMALAIAAGCGVVWLKSAAVGTVPIAGFAVADLDARVLTRQDEPARKRIVLVLATREPRGGRAIRVRLALPVAADRPGLGEGAVIRVRARLMPPQPPQLPGGYDFARAAWFEGTAATGSALGPVVVIHPAGGADWLAAWRHRLADHVRARIAGSAGGIAAAFASGDRGGVAAGDDRAMRDAGLTHLLSVSGLHVAAVVGLAYGVVLRLLALSPWLALRVRLPLVAAAAAAAAGVGYTLLTGAEVPTVRSCLGALLAMAALALGRSPLSMRLLAVAALAVMLAWPEAVVSPGFQMSFGSVIAIVAVAQSGAAQGFLSHRGEGWAWRGLRHLFMILLTGMVIDLALMPIALFHFHRAGLYGSLANVLAIPLTTFVTMPLLALALLLDVAGLGGPVWRLVDLSLRLLLGIAHGVSAQPGARGR
ncbi:MAG: ComEC/Rec2 family competence protein [Sphingomonadales bacterium]|nr:ComEC/Rec2 family competence protein [Sphingomonadales bacterium]